MNARLPIVLAVCASVLSAQDPVAPPGGFTVLTSTAFVTFSDGVSTGIDFYVPDAVPGPSGWPGVLVLHGSDQNKNIPEIAAIGRNLAAAGYVAYAYTQPQRATQERDFLDCAESHGLAQAVVLGTVIDPSRIAVTGISGGGRKSYAAAAYSGKPLPLAGFVTHHPTVLAVAPEIAPLDMIEVAVPQGTLAADYLVIGKAANDPIVQAIGTGDYPALRTLLDTTFNQSLLAELATATVPILAMIAMQDFKIVNNPSIDALLTVPSGPKRLLMSTGGGHSTVDNAMERAVMQDMRRRWFDHFLKGVANGVELEPLVEIGLQPQSTPLHLDPNTIWEHRQEPVWPPPLAPTRYHLVGTQGLSLAPPVAVDLSNVVTHAVPAGYDVNAYIDLAGPGPGGGLEPLQVIGNLPLSSQLFGSPPLAETIEIVGRPQVHLTVDDTTGVFQLTAVLAHTDPAGTTHWITAGTTGVRSGVAGTTQLTIDLGDVAQIVPAGHSLRLRIQNLCDFNAPNSRRIRIVPYFTSSTTRLLVGPANGNHLDLPARPYGASLTPRLAFGSAAAGIAHQLPLRAGLQRAFQPYGLVLGISGEAPGTTLSGLHVPLNPDAVTEVGLQLLNSVFLPHTFGVLSGAGVANPTPSLVVPPSIAGLFVGARFTFVGLVLDATGAVEAVGGPTTLILGP